MQESVNETKMVQQYALDIFKEFKRICEKNKLRYFAIGGTCIGAIRHKGFIPWDDDIDVAMPAEDYHKFMSVFSQELKKPYAVFLPKDSKHYTMSFGKIQNVDTTFVEETVRKFPDRYIGVNIDVFPVYGLPEDEKEVQRIVWKNELLRKINFKIRLPFSECESMSGKLLWILLTPLRLLPFHFVTDWQDKMLSKHPFEESERVYFSWRLVPDTSAGSTYTYKNIFPLADFQSTINVPFENTEIAVPAGYDRYLTMDFGDYMKLPPKEAQLAGHPKAILDFERPYTEYLRKKE